MSEDYVQPVDSRDQGLKRYRETKLLSLSNQMFSHIHCFFSYYISKIEELQIKIRDKTQNFERLKAQRNELNNKVKLMREELMQLHEPGSYVGEVVKAMGKQKVLVKVNPDGKYVVDIDKDIDINKCTPNTRVALKSDSYTLHKILPTKVDPLVSLMKVSFPLFHCPQFFLITNIFYNIINSAIKCQSKFRWKKFQILHTIWLVV
jgi:hypothetical protein